MNLGELRRLLLLQARTDAPDVSLSAPTWINLSILRICKEQPPQGWWFTRTIETLMTDVNGRLTLSSYPIQVRSVIHASVPLERIDPSSSYLFAAATSPAAYYVVGKEIVIVPPPPPGLPFRVVYDKMFPELVNDTDENELTVFAPETVVHGALIEVALHLGRVEDAKIWEERFQRSLDELRRLNLRRREVYVGDVLSDARPT